MASIAKASRAVIRQVGTAPLSTNAAPKALKHRPVMPFNGVYPAVAPDAFIAPSATVIGNVELNYASSVWYNAVVRGDKNKVTIGHSSVVGDRVTITTASSLDSGFPAVCEIEGNVIIGSGSSLRSCTILEGAKIGENCTICEVNTSCAFILISC
jgi:gamma-carbonic anhydrase